VRRIAGEGGKPTESRETESREETESLWLVFGQEVIF
jgi:hypothetical protein